MDPINPIPQFFEAGKTYVLKEYGSVWPWRFRCDAVTTHPEDKEERVALGWVFWHEHWKLASYEDLDWNFGDAFTEEVPELSIDG